MPVYVWKGRTLAGETQAGEIDVARQEDAIGVLRKKKILVTSLKQKSGGFALPKFGGSGVSTKDLAIFTRQFATMISAGLPPGQCPAIPGQQSSKPSLGRGIPQGTRGGEAGAAPSPRRGRPPTRVAGTFPHNGA